MIKTLITRTAVATAIVATLAFGATAPVHAREGNSIGGGIKCYWALISSLGGVNTYQQVCSKGV